MHYFGRQSLLAKMMVDWLQCRYEYALQLLQDCHDIVIIL